MAWQILMSGEVEAWLASADESTRQQTLSAIEALSVGGPQLGRPFVDTIAGSRFKNMKELRPGSAGRSKIRILFIFDPLRQAYLLLAGDKAGKWNKWYQDNFPLAEDIYTKYLEGIGK